MQRLYLFSFATGHLEIGNLSKRDFASILLAIHRTYPMRSNASALQKIKKAEEKQKKDGRNTQEARVRAPNFDAKRWFIRGCIVPLKFPSDQSHCLNSNDLKSNGLSNKTEYGNSMKYFICFCIPAELVNFEQFETTFSVNLLRISLARNMNSKFQVKFKSFQLLSFIFLLYLYYI